jgi:molybdopterin synthase catalytic subunit
MPIIRIDYDNEQIGSDEIRKVSSAIRDIVSEVTGIEDVFVYGNSSEIKIKVAPVEIFVEMSAHKIKDIDGLMEDLKSRLSAWKKETGIETPLNLSIIPMPWKIEIAI